MYISAADFSGCAVPRIRVGDIGGLSEGDDRYHLPANPAPSATKNVEDSRSTAFPYHSRNGGYIVVGDYHQQARLRGYSINKELLSSPPSVRCDRNPT
jgi:hypothetical protein